MHLRTASTLITTTLLLNKVSGLYGLLAIFTGYALSPLQLSMYIYSVLALAVFLYLFPHIRRASPLQCLSLAYMVLLDSLINAVYTALFGVAWFLVLTRHVEQGTGTHAARVLGGNTIDDTSGFTSPEVNVSKVDVVASPASDALTGQEAVAVGTGMKVPAGAGAASSGAALGSALFQSGSVASMTVIAAFWVLRLYAVFVVFAYARSVLRQHVYTTSYSQPNFNLQSGAEEGMAENPFREGREEGSGWRGALGRALVKYPREYWLGADSDGEWIKGMGGRFQKPVNLQPPGVVERERRRRSGTGPPKPAEDLKTVGR
jgi:inositol phosphorylceramide synthase regulatory subunit